MVDFYISPSGLDTNPGTIDAPFKTYAAAEKRVPASGSARFLFDANGNHGPIYIKRDGLAGDPNIFDVYNGSYAHFEFDDATTAVYTKGRKNIVYQNLWVKMRKRKTGFFVHGSDNITLRDCVVEEAGYGIDLGTTTAPSSNITLERVVVRNCWDVLGNRSQGLYALNIHGLKLLNCIFSRNGWKEGSPQHVFVQQNHNVYLAETNTNVEIRDCYLGEACSHGIQLRCGGIISGCLFYFNPIHAFGQNDEAIFENNVLEGSRDLGHGTATITDVKRGWGYDAEAAHNIVRNNLFINGGSDISHSHALDVGAIERSTQPDAGTIVEGNRVYNWKVNAYRNLVNRPVDLADNRFQYTPNTLGSIPFLGDVDKRNWPNIPQIRDQLMKDYEPVNVGVVVKSKLEVLQNTTKAQIETAQANLQSEMKTINDNFQAGISEINKFIEENN